MMMIKLYTVRSKRRRRVLFLPTLWLMGCLLLQQSISTIVTHDETTASADIVITEEEAVSETNSIARVIPLANFRCSESESQSRRDSNNNILIVSTVDGTLAGLEKQTGKILWKRPGNIVATDTEQQQNHPLTKQHQTAYTISEAPSLLDPLVSTTTTVQSSNQNMDWRTTAVPSLDGHVFLTAPGTDHNPVTVTTSLHELTARAPFVDARGRLYTANKRATAVAVDPLTGEILQQISADRFDPQANAPNHGFWMGRVDYTVSIHEAKSMNMDVSFGASEIVTTADMILTGPQPWNSNLDSMWSLGTPTKTTRLVTTPSGHAGLRNLETGTMEWICHERFATPIAFAMDTSSGTNVPVDVVPDAAMPNSGSLEYLSRDMERQLDLIAQDEHDNDDERTLVGSLPNGQLYAVSLGGKQEIHQPHLTTASSLSSQQSKQSQIKVAQISGRQHSSLHNTYDSKHTPTNPKKPCAPGHTNFPGCLILSEQQKNAFARGPGGVFLSESTRSEKIQDNAIVPFYHPEYGYIPPQHFYTLQQKDPKRKYQTFLKILGSWLPPTIALIFVVSFELGRRKRQKDRGSELDSDLITTTTIGKGTNVGVIQVYEDIILGYGGHGTVVYKGMLEGRQVAVKRMLKAYHASADREISLLIESDGHPNVVRYFLKEIRGDFVYLALELCDLSLHDLIGSLRSAHESSWSSKTVLPSAKKILLQISNGVRHLHHLRIVHRDLKPANILLADTQKSQRRRKEESESVLLIYERGDYVAKISDMGLGKQLTGQSSYGASTQDPSFRGHSLGGQSSIVGTGPGSVGWQAPEVMALRVNSDASVRSDGSSPAASFVEASPIETSTNARTSRSVDIFSLGCIFYSTLIPGSHPFGEWYEREANIMHNRPNIEALKSISGDAYNLVASMIQRNPSLRPTARQICEHPFFWPPDRKLSFLCDFSDRLETDAMTAGDESHSFLFKLLAVERNASKVVGIAWDKDLDGELINNVQRFRTYDPSSVRDLLRLIRNKHHHFDELPDAMKYKMGSNTVGLMAYFEERFPDLVIHCYSVCREVLTSDDMLAAKYFIIPFKRPSRTLVGQVSTLTEETTNGDTNSDNKDDGVTTLASEEVLDADIPAIEEENISTDHVPNLSHGNEMRVLENHRACTMSELLFASNAKIAEIDNQNKDKVFNSEKCGSDLALCSLSQQASDQLDVGNVREESPFLLPSVGSDIIVWEGSMAAKSFNNRGWNRSDDEWVRKVDGKGKKRDVNILRCADDPKFRTRLCNHWDNSLGTFCPMRRKNKCVFAHGPVELRIKEGKRGRWGKLVDKNGDNKNPKHSGGEDTYGTARSIETERKQEGKWNVDRANLTGKNQPRQKQNIFDLQQENDN